MFVSASHSHVHQYDTCFHSFFSSAILPLPAAACSFFVFCLLWSMFCPFFTFPFSSAVQRRAAFGRRLLHFACPLALSAPADPLCHLCRSGRWGWVLASARGGSPQLQPTAHDLLHSGVVYVWEGRVGGGTTIEAARRTNEIGETLFFCRHIISCCSSFALGNSRLFSMGTNMND